MPSIEQLIPLITIAADAELVPRFAHVEPGRKADGSIVTEADLAMQQRLHSALSTRWPAIPLLGEEMAPEQQEALLREADALWCLDPLDGTSNFTAGLPYFAVSLALVRNGRVALGIVYDPMRRECFTAVRGQGAQLNGTPLTFQGRPWGLHRSIALVDLKRLPKALAVRLASAPPYASQRSFGSSALDWCTIAAGRCHIYLHGKQRLWDLAAGSLILEEAGGLACTLEGDPVFLPQLEPRSVVAALDHETFRSWCAWLEVPVEP